jgi:HEPN domain-containing protein
VRLLAFYISARYPAYKEKMAAIVNKGEAQEIMEKTKEVFTWVQSLKKYLIK